MGRVERDKKKKDEEIHKLKRDLHKEEETAVRRQGTLEQEKTKMVEKYQDFLKDQ